MFENAAVDSETLGLQSIFRRKLQVLMVTGDDVKG
jgi:hypothetical protein